MIFVNNNKFLKREKWEKQDWILGGYVLVIPVGMLYVVRFKRYIQNGSVEYVQYRSNENILSEIYLYIFSPNNVYSLDPKKLFHFSCMSILKFP